MSTTKTELLKIIRNKCLECTCNQALEVRLCPLRECPLWPFRLAKDPYKTELSDAQKQARMEALQKARQSRKS